jgi:photosystem II stability/assembly factor-like uncharacterized protein
MKYSKTFMILLFCCSSSLAQWQQQKNYISNYTFGRAIDACDSSTAVFYGTLENNQGLFVTVDGGRNWNPRIIPEGSITDLEIISPNHIWYSTITGNIFYSGDLGTNWTKQYSGGKEIGYIKMFDQFSGISVGDALIENTLTVLNTYSSGAGWHYINSQKIGGVLIDWRRIDFVNIKTGYYFSGSFDQKLYKTIDGGNSWTPIAVNNFFNLIKFFDENIGMACSVDWAAGKLIFFRTTDGGNSWKETNSAIYENWPSDLEFVPGDASKIWFASLNNLYFSADDGKTWDKESVADDKLYFRDIVFVNNKTGWLLCDEGKIFYTNNNGGILSSVNADQKNIPASFQLNQNYPNPFNPVTTISYVIPNDLPAGKAGVRNLKDFSSASSPRNDNINVTLKVYDVLGREVATLVNEEQQPGMYNVKFTMNSSLSTFTRHWRASSTLSSAVYFYRLEAGGFTAVKKMIFIK